MTSYNIIKAKLVDRLFVEAEFNEVIQTKDGDEVDTVIDEGAKKCRRIAHPDLVAAFDALTPHLPLLCEVLGEDKLLEADDVKLESFTVTGFTIGGEGEHEGVTLIGRKKLKSGKV